MRRSRNWRFSALTVHALLSIALIVGFASASRAHNFFHTAKVGGAEDEEGDYPSCDAEGEPNASDAEPVGVFTGKWFYRHVDLEVPGVFPIRLVRRYDSRTKYQSPLGYGWAFTYDMRLFEYPGDDADPDDDSIIIRNACGQRHRYIKNGSAYEPEEDLPGWRRTLAPDPSVTGGFILSDPRGTKWFFDDDGKMTQIRDPQGNSLRFEYSASKEPLWGTSPFSVNPDEPLVVSQHYRLMAIREYTASENPLPTDDNPSGRAITFDYADDGGDDDDGRLLSATTHDGRTVTYDHEQLDVGGVLRTTGNLTTADVNAIIQTFDYTDPNFPHAVTYFQDGAGMRGIENEYDGEGRVVEQRLADTHVPVFAFNYDPENIDFNYVYDYDYNPPGIPPQSCDTLKCTVVTQSILDPTDAVIGHAITSYKFDAEGFPLDVIDAEGNQTYYVYESVSGQSTRHYLDRIETFYNQGIPTEPNRVREKYIDLTFDLRGNLESRAVSVDGTNPVTETWHYDPSQGWVDDHTIQEAGSADQFKTTFEFKRNGSGEITNIWKIHRHDFYDGTTKTATLDYDGNGRLTSAILPDLHEISWAYYTASDDGGGVIRNGLLKQAAHGPVTAPDPHLKTTYDYDEQGLMSTVTDARGFTTSLTWDDLGRITQIENALQERTILTYGGPNPSDPGRYLVGLEIGQTEETPGEIVGGQISRYGYDGLGNLTTVERTDDGASFAREWTFTSDTNGHRLSETNGSSRVYTYAYDLLGRRISFEDEELNQTRFDYDASGNLILITDAATPAGRRVSFEYDALDRLERRIEEDVPETPTTEFFHDAAGNVTLVEDANDHQTIYEYDGLSRLRKVFRPSDAVNPVATYSYDDRNRLSEVLNARGQKVVYGYETWGPVQTESRYSAAPALDRTLTYDYDLSGNLLSVVDGAFDLVTPLYEAVSPDPGNPTPPPPYDGLDRLEKLEIHLPGLSAKFLTYSYDAFGNTSGVVFDDGSDSFVHGYPVDGFDRLEYANLPGSQQVAFEYVDDPAGTWITNDLKWMKRSSNLWTEYFYKNGTEAYGPLKRIEFSNQGAAPFEEIAYVTNSLLQVTQLTHTTAGGAAVSDFTYDDANHLATAVHTNGLPSDDFTYDPAGNREDAVDPDLYDYNADDELIKSPAFAKICYDADGNTSYRGPGPNCGDGAGETFTFDHVNRLISFAKAGTTASYVYDAFGRRMKKVVDEGGGPETTWFVWNGDQLLAEYDGAGSRTVRYAYAGAFAPLQVALPAGPGSETIYDVHTDRLDTPRLLTDASQTVVWRAAYEAFGKATPDENPDGDGTSVTFNIRFPGQYYDAETGLHYNRFRYYDPGIGRYISADPIGQAGGVNVFTYGLDDPINNFDPTGLNWVVEFAINTNQGLAAFADGFIPFADPFAAAGFYDPCDPTLKWSYYSGAATLAAEIGLAAYGAAYGFGPIGGGAAAEAAAAGAEGASNSEPGDVSGAADAIEEFLGGPGEVKRNKAGDPVIIKDDRKVRFDSNNPHGDEPHFHLERKEPNGRWRDAGPKHRYYFKKD